MKGEDGATGRGKARVGVAESLGVEKKSVVHPTRLEVMWIVVSITFDSRLEHSVHHDAHQDSSNDCVQYGSLKDRNA